MPTLGRLNLPASFVPARGEAPFTTSTGQPAFLARLQAARREFPESIPTRFELFTSKEVDSGIIYAETPSATASVSTPSSGASDAQSGVGTPESSTCSGVAHSSIAEALHVGATDVAQLVRLLADNFKLVQFTSPRVALVFVGK